MHRRASTTTGSCCDGGLLLVLLDGYIVSLGVRGVELAVELIGVQREVLRGRRENGLDDTTRRREQRRDRRRFGRGKETKLNGKLT